MNGYTYTYDFGDPDITNAQLKPFAPTAQKQKDPFNYYPKIHPTDIVYNVANNTDELKVYAVYSITVKNNTTTNIDDKYVEQKLYLSELNASYDSNRFELSTAEIGDENENKEFKLWSLNNNKLVFNKDATVEDGNKFANGIAPLAVETTHIQFRVKDDMVRNILTNPKLVNDSQVPTQVSVIGYHEYLRTDNLWNDNKDVVAFSGAKGKDEYPRTNGKSEKYYVHKSEKCYDTSSALYLKFGIGETRKINGIVFEDKDVITNDMERIGNGKFDENENTVKGVLVTLLHEDGSVAKLYKNKENGVTIENAISNSNEYGKYELDGVVPGKYYLQFTYGNGETKYKDLNNNIINIETQINGKNEPINPRLYKSTILTGKAKEEREISKLNDNSIDVKRKWYQTWFIDEIGKNNSVATDSDTIVSDRMKTDNLTKELNSKYEKEEATDKVIAAESPKIDIKIEMTENDEGPYDAEPPADCSGLSFGIIERPHVNITLTKTIKNLKLTLQNGTTIINGSINGTSPSPNIAKISDSNAKLELDSSYIYGSNAVVTYALSAHNKSELDYATNDYYKYGEIEDTAKEGALVKTTVAKIVDYLNNQNASYEYKSENVIEENISNKEDYFSTDALEKNKNYKQIIFKPETTLYPEAYNRGQSSTEEFEFTVNNLLSNSDGILGWESYSEIIGIKNITLTPQYECHSGNYEIGNQQTREPDTANATVTITPSTGENKNLMTYYIVGGALITISLGIILLKRFVLRK